MKKIITKTGKSNKQEVIHKCTYKLVTLSRSALLMPKSFGTETSMMMAECDMQSQTTISGLMAPFSIYLPVGITLS